MLARNEGGRSMRKMFRLAMMLGALAAVVGATGCNTVHGVGEDIEAAGDAISKSAQRSRTY
jgi:predicted small secreted protein